jgi:predicted nucleotidyltransferase
MNIRLYDLLSTGERVKILKDILYEAEVKVSETAKRNSLSKGLVSKYLDILVNEGVMKRNSGGFVILDNYKVKALKAMLNILSIPEIFSKYGFVKAVGLYGSAVKGTNTKESDFDVWIKVDSLKNPNLPKLNAELIAAMGKVNILFLDDSKILELKKKDLMFYYSLFFGSVMVYGSENEIHY